MCIYVFWVEIKYTSHVYIIFFYDSILPNIFLY